MRVGAATVHRTVSSQTSTTSKATRKAKNRRYWEMCSRTLELGNELEKKENSGLSRMAQILPGRGFKRSSGTFGDEQILISQPCRDCRPQRKLIPAILCRRFFSAKESLNKASFGRSSTTFQINRAQHPVE